MVDAKMTMPVMPEARKDDWVLERPAWLKIVGAYFEICVSFVNLRFMIARETYVEDGIDAAELHGTH